MRTALLAACLLVATGCEPWDTLNVPEEVIAARDACMKHEFRLARNGTIAPDLNRCTEICADSYDDATCQAELRRWLP